MKKRILVLCLALCLLLTGCSTGDKKAADIPGRLTIGNINALCQDAQLLESGKELLTALSDDLLLCLALDIAAPATAEQLAGYDHIALISAKWLEQYGSSVQLETVDEAALSNAQRSYLTQYMADRTVDGSALPGGAALYTLKKGSLSLLGADASASPPSNRLSCSLISPPSCCALTHAYCPLPPAATCSSPAWSVFPAHFPKAPWLGRQARRRSNKK